MEGGKEVTCEIGGEDMGVKERRIISGGDFVGKLADEEEEDELDADGVRSLCRQMSCMWMLLGLITILLPHVIMSPPFSFSPTTATPAEWQICLLPLVIFLGLTVCCCFMCACCTSIRRQTASENDVGSKTDRVLPRRQPNATHYVP